MCLENGKRVVFMENFDGKIGVTNFANRWVTAEILFQKTQICGK